MGNALTVQGKLQLSCANAADARVGAGLTGTGYGRVMGVSPSLGAESGTLTAPTSTQCSRIPPSYPLDRRQILRVGRFLQAFSWEGETKWKQVLVLQHWPWG